MLNVFSAMMLAVGSGGMAPKTTEWHRDARDAIYLGTYADFRGHHASFYWVRAKVPYLLGPLDHDRGATDENGVAAPAVGTFPAHVARGAQGRLEFFGVTSTSRREAATEGTFISFVVSKDSALGALSTEVRDPLGLGLLAADPTIGDACWDRIRALSDVVEQYQAWLGLVLAGAKEKAMALIGPAQTTPALSQAYILGQLLLSGLPGLAAASPCEPNPMWSCHPFYTIAPIAKAWLAGDLALAARLVSESGLGTRFHFTQRALWSSDRSTRSAARSSIRNLVTARTPTTTTCSQRHRPFFTNFSRNASLQSPRANFAALRRR